MKISYIIAHGVAECVNFTSHDSSTLSFRFKPEYNGALIIGNQIFEVKNGCTDIDTVSLGDGEYTPRLECDGGCIAVRGFIKSGRAVSVLKSDEETVRHLVKSCFALERSRLELSERIAELEHLCKGHAILNFERK